jgi:acylphosphatase
MKKRLHIYYSGTVQGVGFRFMAENIANSLGLTGWVKNLSDGRVEVLCEGEEADLISFIDKMKNGPLKRYVVFADAEWEDPRNEFRDFAVRF